MPPEPPPVPIAAQVESALAKVTCTFDRPLTPGPGVILAWTIRANIGAGVNFYRPAFPPIAAGNTVTWSTFNAGATFGPPIISYTVPPGTLAGVTGQPVAEFLGFPLTVLP